MDKYTKALLMIIKVPVGVFCILLGLSLIGVSVWVSTFSDIASMLFLISLLGGGFLINYGVGYAFLGDEYKATHIVHNGNTKYAPVESTKFLKRRKIVTFIGFISYILLAIYYVVRVILTSIYMSYLQQIDFNSNIVALVIFAVISLVFAFCLFMVYKRTKHIDLNEK
jgi:hypothetical protein